jgi:predicted SprT family Zn-dependent metalloprotease
MHNGNGKLPAHAASTTAPFSLRRVSLNGLSELAATVLVKHAPELRLPAIKVSGRMTRTFGSYTPTSRQVTLSSRLLALGDPEDQREILLHELAHAITHHRHPKATAHGREFKAVCHELGVGPRRYVNLPVHKWVSRARWSATCDACGSLMLRTRAVRTMRCDCGQLNRPRRLSYVARGPAGAYLVITTRTLR